MEYVYEKKGGYGGGTTHELRQLICNFGSLQNLLLTPTVPELRIRVINGVLVVLGC